MKVLAKVNYMDKELKRTILRDEVFEVSEERAKELLAKGLIWGDDPKEEKIEELKEEKPKAKKKTTKKAK